MEIIKNGSEFLDVKQAAVFLGVSVDTVYAWTMRKTIPHYKLGRLVKFKKSDLITHMESLRVEPCKKNDCHQRVKRLQDCLSETMINLKSPINRFGGKFYLRDWLLRHIPKHTLYCEVFAGAGHLLFAKTSSQAEILNDIDGSLINFFRVIPASRDMQGSI